MRRNWKNGQHSNPFSILYTLPQPNRLSPPHTSTSINGADGRSLFHLNYYLLTSLHIDSFTSLNPPKLFRFGGVSLKWNDQFRNLNSQFSLHVCICVRNRRIQTDGINQICRCFRLVCHITKTAQSASTL